MAKRVFGLLWLIVCIAALPLRAEELTPEAKRAEAEEVLSKLDYRQGEVDLGGVAKLQVSPDFRFLGPDDAEKVLTKVWGNPPDGKKPLGLLLSGADATPATQGAWAVLITFQEDGYIKDDDATSIDYDKLLKQMQEGAEKENQERTKQGYPPIRIVGWAAKPRYDAASHKLYWAKEIAFGNAEENTLNYNIRVLGRRGVLNLNVIAQMPELASVEEAAPTLLGMVDFTEGNRYADYKPGTDKIATYGLAALVAGGIAAKLGFFKILLGFLIALKKFAIIGIVAVGAFLKRIVQGRGRKPSPPSDPPTPS